MSKVPKGESGRVVIEIEPDFKQELYDAVHQHGYDSLKAWFLERARELIGMSQEQAEIPFPELSDSRRTGVQ